MDSLRLQCARMYPIYLQQKKYYKKKLGQIFFAKNQATNFNFSSYTSNRVWFNNPRIIYKNSFLYIFQKNAKHVGRAISGKRDYDHMASNASI